MCTELFVVSLILPCVPSFVRVVWCMCGGAVTESGRQSDT